MMNTNSKSITGRLEASRKLLKQKPWLKPLVEPYWSQITDFLNTLETKNIEDITPYEWEMFEVSMNEVEKMLERIRRGLLTIGGVSVSVLSFWVWLFFYLTTHSNI